MMPEETTSALSSASQGYKVYSTCEYSTSENDVTIDSHVSVLGSYEIL